MKVMNNKQQTFPAFTSTLVSSFKINSKIKYAVDRCSQQCESGDLMFCHYTRIARADYNWKKLPELLNDRFEKQDKVTVNLHGGSDGSDGYTFIINAMHTLGEKAKKFFPVLSSDISPDIIKGAQEGKILLSQKDLDYLHKQDALKYFERDLNEPPQIQRDVELFPFKVKPELRDKIEFSVKDVRRAVKEEDFSDSVFLFRNGWGFNTIAEQNEIAENLYKNSNKKTLIGIGQSDLFKSDASDALQRNNFKGVETDVFTFGETDYPAEFIGTPKSKPLYKSFGFFEK